MLQLSSLASNLMLIVAMMGALLWRGTHRTMKFSIYNWNTTAVTSLAIQRWECFQSTESSMLNVRHFCVHNSSMHWCGILTSYQDRCQYQETGVTGHYVLFGVVTKTAPVIGSWRRVTAYFWRPAQVFLLWLFHQLAVFVTRFWFNSGFVWIYYNKEVFNQFQK